MITVQFIAYYLHEKFYSRKRKGCQMTSVEGLQECCAALNLDSPRAIGESLGHTDHVTPKIFIRTCSIPKCELRRIILEGSSVDPPQKPQTLGKMLLSPPLYFDGMKKLILNVSYPGISPASPETTDKSSSPQKLAKGETKDHMAQAELDSQLGVTKARGDISPESCAKSQKREKFVTGKMAPKSLFGKPPQSAKAKGVMTRQYASAVMRENKATLSFVAKLAVIVIYVVIGVAVYFVCCYFALPEPSPKTAILDSVATTFRSADPSFFYRAMLHSAFGAN